MLKPRLKLRRDSIWQEWIVAYLEFDLSKMRWVTNDDKSYHTDDKDDALGTMFHMQKEIDLKYEAFTA